MMYMVTAVRDIYEYSIEIAGIFDTEEKAYEAKAIVERWMEDEEYEDYEVFVTPTEVNRIAWYDIGGKI